jgi:hypothetical protein
MEVEQDPEPGGGGALGQGQRFRQPAAAVDRRVPQADADGVEAAGAQERERIGRCAIVPEDAAAGFDPRQRREVGAAQARAGARLHGVGCAGGPAHHDQQT